MEHKIDLEFGYTDKDGTVHREVTFGKRPTAGDLMLLDMNPAAQLNTQYVRLIHRLLITKFGTLRMPLDLSVLLALDTRDDDLITAGADEFLLASREGRASEFRQNEALLAFGVEVSGQTYHVVRFGNRLTVKDYVEADRRRLVGCGREAYLIGRQVSEIASADGSLSVAGQLKVEQFSSVDSEDFNVLRFAAEFFRLEVPRTREGNGSVEPDNSGVSQSDGLERGTDSAAADGSV